MTGLPGRPVRALIGTTQLELGRRKQMVFPLGVIAMVARQQDAARMLILVSW